MRSCPPITTHNPHEVARMDPYIDHSMSVEALNNIYYAVFG